MWALLPYSPGNDVLTLVSAMVKLGCVLICRDVSDVATKKDVECLNLNSSVESPKCAQPLVAPWLCKESAQRTAVG